MNRLAPATRRFLISASVLAMPVVGVLAGTNLVPAGWPTWVAAAAVGFLPFAVLLRVSADGRVEGLLVAAAGAAVAATALLLDLFGEQVQGTVLASTSSVVDDSTGATVTWRYVLAGPDGERIPGELLLTGARLEAGAAVEAYADPGGWAGPSQNSYDGWAPWSALGVVAVTGVLFAGAHWSSRGTRPEED
ncbi:hypothetical protein [Actinorhabdospora filicis]|nr:hypothetical protein [Actinorhabdospora filicis]